MKRKIETELGPKDYLTEQARLHPSMRPLDMIKLCYQAAFGAEHLLQNLTVAKRFFDEEFSAAVRGSSKLYEKLSSDCCRVNLFAWKERGIPQDWLFQMFAISAAKPAGTEEEFCCFLHEADELCAAGSLPFTYHDWENERNVYGYNKSKPVHHSDQYRKMERPAYRLVSTRFIRLFPLLERAAKRIWKNETFVIALDGRAASGKTTMADELSQILGAGIVHMDDFFLPAKLRTENRLAEPGGNVQYERFAQEVLPQITQVEAFSYRRFDCLKMDFGDVREVCKSKWRIVEGAYSCHPFYGDYMDIKVFSEVGQDEQLRRIELRNGAKKAKIFAERWIPLEERYFEMFHIPENADLIL